MNKLGKRQARPDEFTAAHTSSTSTPVSRTMQLALSAVTVSQAPRDDDSRGVLANLQRRGTWFSAPLAAAPHTKVERYWAARALVAETLLSARDQHQAELAEMRRMEERKREREIETILRAGEQRQRSSERMMVVCLAVLFGSMCWLVATIASARDSNGRPSKPSHYTIPILSPFASVVEHETGVIGARTIVLIVVAIGIAAYAAFRRQISQWHAR